MTPIEMPFVLPGFAVDEVQECNGVIEIRAHSTSSAAICPACGQRSQHVHSYYQRSPADLPISKWRVRLRLTVKRYRCRVATCPKATFAEALPDLVARNAQRTDRLTIGLGAVAFAVGGQAGNRLADKLNMPTSGDTLLRIIRATPLPAAEEPGVLGVDDWAQRRGRVYGTMWVDLERHRVIDLLDDRTAQTLAEWLKSHTQIAVVTRDRSTEYTRGIALGAPQAQQVADRWHLLVNLREALQRLLDRLRPETIYRNNGRLAFGTPRRCGGPFNGWAMPAHAATSRNGSMSGGNSPIRPRPAAIWIRAAGPRLSSRRSARSPIVSRYRPPGNWSGCFSNTPTNWSPTK